MGHNVPRLDPQRGRMSKLVAIKTRVTPEQREALEAAAAADGFTNFSEWVRVILARRARELETQEVISEAHS